MWVKRLKKAYYNFLDLWGEKKNSSCGKKKMRIATVWDLQHYMHDAPWYSATVAQWRRWKGHDASLINGIQADECPDWDELQEGKAQWQMFIKQNWKWREQDVQRASLTAMSLAYCFTGKFVPLFLKVEKKPTMNISGQEINKSKD